MIDLSADPIFKGEHPVTNQPTAENAEWSREQWLAYADGLLDVARRFASPGAGRIHFPGDEGGYGHAIDGLEGFARTFLIAGFRIAGARGEGVDDLIDFYARGIATGVDPDAPDRWVRMEEHAQAKVEAASLALVLDLTRPWIWDRLDALTQERTIAYFAPVVGDDTYPRNNWVWFRIVVQTFLRSVGGPWSQADITADLARHETFVRDDGWLSDGDERSYDHYVGWALHVYPILWSRMAGADELAGDRTAGDVARLDRFLLDALTLVGGDGSPLIEGRSLIYRYAAAAAFWMGVVAEVPSSTPGQLRHAANAIVAHFDRHQDPTADGVLTMGWHGEWRALAQSYSGPGSPYWAAKGLIGILLPADHPVWSSPAEPLPVEQGDVLRAIASPGWVVSATQADGIVRVVNHGTDHAVPGSMVGDSPLYARLGYSTAVAPLLNEQAWTEPLEQSVALVDAAGRATHRAGMQLLGARVQDDENGCLGIAASSWAAHWVAAAPPARRHGNGLIGEVEVAGRITVHSLVRGAWEVRVTVVDALEPTVSAGDLRLRVGGWVMAADEVATAQGAQWAAASAAGRVSGIRSLSSTQPAAAGLVRRDDASPLGPSAIVPTVEYDVNVGTPVVTLIELAGAASGDAPAASTATVHLDADSSATVTWPDGRVTVSRLTDPGSTARAARNHETQSRDSHAIAKEQHA